MRHVHVTDKCSLSRFPVLLVKRISANCPTIFFIHKRVLAQGSFEQANKAILREYRTHG